MSASVRKGVLINEHTLASRLYKLATLIVVVVPFAAVPIAIWQLWNEYVGWWDVGMLLLTAIPISFGVTVGYHRHFTHRSFQAKPVVRAVLGVLGLLALENTIVSWVANHKMHHRFSDLAQDLHSPMGDLLYAHVGWFFKDEFADPRYYASWLLKDSLVLRLDRLYPLLVVVSLFGPFALGALYGYLFREDQDVLWAGFQTWIWAGLLRVFLVHHFTWSINSICHTYGERPYRTPTNDQSANVWWLLLSMGENYHNNHHAKERSARHGTNYLNDPSFALIKLLERLGLVWDVYVPTDEEYEALRVSPNMV